MLRALFFNRLPWMRSPFRAQKQLLQVESVCEVGTWKSETSAIRRFPVADPQLAYVVYAFHRLLILLSKVTVTYSDSKVILVHLFLS